MGLIVGSWGRGLSWAGGGGGIVYHSLIHCLCRSSSRVVMGKDCGRGKEQLGAKAHTACYVAVGEEGGPKIRDSTHC